VGRICGDCFACGAGAQGKEFLQVSKEQMGVVVFARKIERVFEGDRFREWLRTSAWAGGAHRFFIV
jgi:hypothetical protein